MPAAIDNGLPHVEWPITDSTNTTGPFDLMMMCDSGPAVTVGNLRCQFWLFSQHPALVHNLEFFNDHNPFDPIKLFGAIKSNHNIDETQFGTLTAVIRHSHGR